MGTEIEERVVTLAQGPVRVRTVGEGPPVLFVHGALVNGHLWDDLVPRLHDRMTMVLPDLPLGGHRQAMAPGADLGLAGQAVLVRDLVAALDRGPMTVVGSDSGGAVTQAVAARYPEVVDRLVLLPCDAFENCPPRLFAPIRHLPRIPGAVDALGRSMARRPVQRALFATVARHPVPADRARLLMGAVATDAGVRRDLATLLRGFDRAVTLEAAERLRSFPRPALVVWGRKDPLFPPDHARRLAALLPDAALEWVEGTRAFVMLDQPARLAELLAGFVAPQAARTATS